MVLKELCALRGIPGSEAPVRDFIMEHVKPFATRVTVDRMGNMAVFKKGTEENARHILFVAHMDEVGMRICGIQDNGLLRYDCAGMIDPRAVVSKPVRVGERAVPGVIGAKAIHLQSAEDLAKVLQHDDLTIDIGANDKASAERLVELGDEVTFDSRWVEFGDGLVKARALDDRVGCMVLMSLLEGEYPCDLTCVFTVQEELGCRGAMAACRFASDAAIIVEGTSANDLNCEDDHQKTCQLKKGAAISLIDHATIADAKLYAALRRTAMERDIPWQVKNVMAGGNDSRYFQSGASARPTCVLSVPCRNIHSPSNVAAFEDIDAVYRLADAFLTAGGAF